MDRKSSYVDELTGVYNRNFLQEKQEGELGKLITKNIPFSVVMVDIDHFKEVNDIHGHLKGDVVLREFAQFLRRAVRSSDAVIRYGGDEFVCIVQGTVRTDVESIYQRIIQRCNENPFGGLLLTLSAGIASFPDDAKDFDTLLKLADEALYDAKRSGRARIGVIRKKDIELPMRVFISRYEEKQRLQAVVADGKCDCAVAIVKGSVGIGKTRLVKEVLRDIHGKEIVWSDCLAFAENIAYYPIREAIKYRIHRLGTAVLGDIPMVSKRELGKLVPEIAMNSADETTIEFAKDKYRLYDSIRKLFESGTREKIIVFDNIQWIDHESTDVIQYLFRALRDTKIVLIYRIEEVTAILERFLSHLVRETTMTEITLIPFEYPEIKESIKAIIGEEPDERLTEYVVQESGGIPFFIEEIVRVLRDQGYLVVEEDHWTLKQPARGIVPKSLEDVTLRKYRSLSKEAQDIADVASVVGWFDIDALRELTGYSETEVAGLVTTLQRLALVKYVKDRCVFAEEISRKAIYQSYVKGIKALMLHGRVAELLEKQHRGNERAVLEELAFHYYRAHNREKGVTYCCAAGDHAYEQYANQAAVQYYTWALEILGDADTQEKRQMRCTCLTKRAMVMNVAGDNVGALKDLDDSLSTARTLRDHFREADALLKRAFVYRDISHYKESVAAAEQARELFRQIGDRKKTADALITLGTTCMKIGDHEESMVFFREATALYRELGDIDDEARGLHDIGVVHRLLGEHDSALSCFDTALNIAHKTNNRNLLCVTLMNIGIVHDLLGNYDRALEYYEKALTIIKEAGTYLNEAEIQTSIGLVKGNRGEYRSALKYHESALRIYREIGFITGEATSFINFSVVNTALGEYDTAMRFCETALAHGQEIGDKRIEAYARNLLGSIYSELGDYDNARTYYETASNMYRTLHMNEHRYMNVLSMAKLCVELHDMARAQELIDTAYALAQDLVSKSMQLEVLLLRCELLLNEKNLEACRTTMKDIQSLFQNIQTKPFGIMVNLIQGRYYTEIKEFQEAERSLKEALALCNELGEKPSTGKVYYFLARMESARRQKKYAQEYLEKALEIFVSIRAQGWQGRVQRALEEQAPL